MLDIVMHIIEFDFHVIHKLFCLCHLSALSCI
ncbi:hypothetical protein J2129_001328 [Methanofollis sp. W23]|nr:hypothetical protein [Methanofollis sp. W23]